MDIEKCDGISFLKRIPFDVGDGALDFLDDSRRNVSRDDGIRNPR
jgi:hypothetical protein